MPKGEMESRLSNPSQWPELPGTISIAATSPGLDPAQCEVVVTLPTFRRPQLLVETLDSLAVQQTARRFAVIVMENDPEGGQGSAAAALRLQRDDMAGMVILAHERGNCSAYNAGWLTALRCFPNFNRLLVIDDDELADPHWLERMCATAEQFSADIVGGPQVPIFENPSLNGWAKHPVFSPAHDVTGPVDILYSSGNLLLGRNVLEAMGPPHLDLRFNFMGGGDSDFLSRSAARGFKLAWCNEAIVRETVPARRVEFGWVRARSLRNGVISTLVEKKKRAGEPFGNLRVALKSLALLGASPLRAAIRLVKTGSLANASYPILVGLGRVMAEFGYANEQYRNPEAN
jgi:glycosyltransferase involved in cell wall biosynthesis